MGEGRRALGGESHLKTEMIDPSVHSKMGEGAANPLEAASGRTQPQLVERQQQRQQQ